MVEPTVLPVIRVDRETLDTWLDREIAMAKTQCTIDRSYRNKGAFNRGYLDALKSVRAKMKELWGI
jgi:hypothetical protein